MPDKKRFFVLDLLRGTAVLIMILAHSVYFFHNYTSRFLSGLEIFGNTVAFTTFLLVSGAVFYIAYLKESDDWEEKKKRIKKRFFILLASYYVMALVVEASHLFTTYGLARWGLILEIFTFRFMPSYTEYIPPFIFYTFLVIFFPRFFKEVPKNVVKMIAAAAILYGFGFLAFKSPTFEYLIPWRAFLAGSPGYFRFPVLQYFPVFLIGLHWGYLLQKSRDLKHKEAVSKMLALFTILKLGVVAAAFVLFGSYDQIFLRWPPSVPFLFLGLSFAFLSVLVLYKAKQLRRVPILRDGLLILGQNAFGIFWAHIFLLQLYQMSGGTKVGSLPIFFLLFSLVLTVSLALAAFIPFNFKFSLTFHRGSHEEEEEFLEEDPIYRFSDEIYEEAEKEVGFIKKFFFPKPDGSTSKKRLIRKRHLLGLSLILLLVSFIVSPSVLQEREKKVKSARAVSWWSDEYAYKIPITIKNKESFSAIPVGQVLSFSFDHQTLVKNKKSRPDGSDIKLIYWNGKKFKEIEFWPENKWGLTDTNLKFVTQDKIPSGNEQKIFLYYGDTAAKSQNNPVKASKEWAYKYEIKIGEEEKFPLLLEVSRIWSLRSDESEIGVSIKSAEKFKNPKAKFRVLKTGIQGEIETTENDLFEGTVHLKGLKSGVYQIQATIEDGSEKFLSQKAGFFVTDPLYVTWTIDWEGYDVSNIYLNALEKVSQEHKIPLTHLFNPRIYTAGISKERQDYLTNWVKEREKKGEEIGLHLHMFYDFVKDAGIEPKKEPNWGDDGDGYGVLTSNYSRDEMKKILERALWWFGEKGFSKPISFRAGGWFANADTLDALEETGFKMDSSGRTAYDFGKNKVKGPWNLSATAEPYHPSKSDQNKQGNDFGLWEVPNNGADSYWFKSEDMIKRFDQNYTGGILNEKKQVTYLSHPQWFNKTEQERIEKVFGYIDSFKYEDDQGPIVYVTLKDIYNEWLKGAE